jgi:hypothetical protein
MSAIYDLNRQVLRLLVTDNVALSSPIFVTLTMEAIRSSESSVLTRATWRHIPEDGLLLSHRCEYLKSYIALTGWALYRRRNMFPLGMICVVIFQKTAILIVTVVIASHDTSRCTDSRILGLGSGGVNAEIWNPATLLRGP